jgi:hypothetical protein
MAELDMSQYRTPGISGVQPGPNEAAASLRAGAFLRFVGAALSIALLTGVVVWSYRLMVRDVSGVPVVRAVQGPMRVSPDDPGGRRAAYQGLAVNAVAAQGTAAPLPQDIVLAPAPVALQPEDMPMAATGAPSQTASPQSVPGDLALVPVTAGGLARSPFPMRRPGGDLVAESAVMDVVARLAPLSANDIDPASLTVGTRLVQLGAYETVDLARQAWADLTTRYPAYFEGRGRVIEAATSGGRTFFRLRAHGFADEPESRRFCAVLLAEGGDCIPVLIRER